VRNLQPNALAYFDTAVSYASKMFMKLAPERGSNGEGSCLTFKHLTRLLKSLPGTNTLGYLRGHIHNT